MIIIHQDVRSVACLHLGGRDQDLDQSTRPRMATPASASLAMEIEKVGTGDECRWMSHASANTARDRMIPGPPLNQEEDLCELPEAGTTDQFRRVQSIARLVMVPALTTDRREGFHETPEACAVGRYRRAKSSAGTIRHSGQERLRRDPRDRTEVNEVRADKETKRGTMIIATGTN